ncbi:MAG: hypothetical protein ABSG37_04265 [Candidatus Limnocylindrales bacterium]
MAKGRDPARHELPAIDEAALAAARDADRLLAGARERGARRWSDFLAALPDQLRDAGIEELRAVAQRARAAYGPKDSIRESLPPELTEPFLADLDRLRKVLARELAER